MADESTRVVIRLGSHAEKEYVLKLREFIDGFTVGANLYEATPGATASLLLKLAQNGREIFIDPMTYAFGAYVDPSTERVRTDLDWIKSEQTRKDKSGRKHIVRDFKRSYRKLSDVLGPPFAEAINLEQAIAPETVADPGLRRTFCRQVAEYQINKTRLVFEEVEDLQGLADLAPRPAAVFAPYFYVEPSRTPDWFNLNMDLMTITAGLGLDTPVHGIVCADVAHLADARFREDLIKRLPGTGVKGVWLWFSKFYEDSTDKDLLVGYRDLVERLSEMVEVNAMRGGFFNLALTKLGLSRIGHGVGYGEQKDVVPVIGQSIPTVRYYLPPVHNRLGVPDIERAFDALGVRTPADFHAKICDCAVCRGVVATALSEFSQFGDMQYSRPAAKRASQTPEAAKRCRYHFILARLAERDRVRGQTLEEIATDLEDAAALWGDQPSLRDSSRHLSVWAEVLRGA